MNETYMVHRKSGSSMIRSLKNMDWKALMVIVPISVAVFWLISNEHNDARYLKTDTYQADQNRLEKTLDEIKKGQDKLLDYLLKKEGK